MDQRPTPTQFYTQPPSHPSPRDPRQPAIHPPPYIQAAPRSQTFFNNDIFLARKREESQHLVETPQLDVNRAGHGAVVGMPYPAGLSRDPVGSAMDARNRLQDSAGSWGKYDDGKMERYPSQGTEVTATAVTSSALPPPPPSASFHPSLHPQPLLDDPTRQKGHRSSSPRMYGAVQNHSTNHSAPLPPPPPFANRHMLPPSSPQYNPPAHTSREPPPPSSFITGGRDLPTVSTNTRPGSSMSIKSMLGTDPTPPVREPPPPHYINGSSATTAFATSGQHTAASPMRLDHGTGPRYRSSPEAQSGLQNSANRFRASSGGVAHPSHPSMKSMSPITPRAGTFSGDAASQISPRSDTGGAPPHESRRQHEKHSSIGRLINRPSSQPAGHHASPAEADRRFLENQVRRLESAKQEDQLALDAARREIRDRGPSFDFLGRQSQFARQEGPKQDHQPKSHQSPPPGRPHASTYPFLSNASVFSEPSNQNTPPEANPSRRVERDAQNQAATPKGPLGVEDLRRVRDQHLAGTTSQPQNPTAFPTSRPRIFDNLEERQPPADSKHASTTPQIDRASSMDRAMQQSRNSEDATHHRSSLALMLDNSKRGRISPFPQAVQGAQGQTNGPSRDPSIKNEFSKMFAGIGSGVSSSGLAGSGTSTPFPPSPKQNDNDQRLPFAGRNDLIEMSKSRNGSRASNKRSRKMRDDDAKDADDSGRSVVDSGGNRGVKKSRHGHHHHAVAHHHHHHYRLDEQTGTPLRTISNPNSTTPISHHHHRAHHHHHPDGTIHYHATSKATPAPQPKPVLRRPTTTIRNSPVLSSIKHLPRRHLGSTLYSPNVEASTPATSRKANLPPVSGQCVIPYYEGKENCTVTVRIPRFYLSEEEREQVCRCCAVWGSDIYTDDSDPLAAAIHAGWIRGAWGDDVDLSKLDITASDEQSASQQSTCMSVPSSPVIPPRGKDLHLTLLILPTLQEYVATISHGIKSRAWGQNHQGMSFRVEKMIWVDEGSGRAEERSGAAKRLRMKRLRAMSNGLGPPVQLGLGKKVAPPAAAAA